MGEKNMEREVRFLHWEYVVCRAVREEDTSQKLTLLGLE